MDQDGTFHGGRPQPRRLCVRWGRSSLPKKGAELLPNFWPIYIVPNGWMHQYTTWHGGRPQPLGMEIDLSRGDFVLDEDPAPSPKRGGAPIFGPRLLWPNGCHLIQR